MRLFPVHKLIFTLTFAALATVLSAQTRPTDEILVDGAKTIAVKVSATSAELNNLAQTAFNAHGAYRRVAGGESYAIAFAPAGPNQVQVQVSRGGTPILSRVVNGSSTRNALLRAADLAVKQTSGLDGFFASRLAFISERTGKTEVYTGDLFSGEVRGITNDRALALSPRWSPDGRQLIYTSYFRSGFPDIFLLDLANMQRKTFVSFKGTNSSARFSADGQRVAMVLSGEGNPEIYAGTAQGQRIRRLTRSSSVESSPCFSPDGSRIVFTSDAAGGPQLYIMSANDGSGARRLPTNISGYCAEPDWSRGAPNKIAFTFASGKSFQIGVYDLNARGPAKQVSKAPFDAVEPSWLADGRHLVFTARSANKRSLWLLDTESGKATRISAEQLGNCGQASVLAP
ncbi:MAG: biopolymer transporter Tol [Verrucomicrobiota bacterium]